MGLSTFDWIYGLLPYFACGGFFFWAYLLQERIEILEKRLDEIEDRE